MDIDFNIPTIITKRNVDSGGNPISVKLIEIRQIMDNYSCVVLSQTPDEFNRIYIEGFTEVFDIEKLDKKNFKVDYNQGIIYFHPFNIGKAIAIEYYGVGYELISASRVFTKVDKYGNVIDTLEEILNRVSLQLKLIESLGGAIKVIEKLDEDIKNANNLNAYFDEMIPEATELKNELDTIVTDAKGWKDQLKQDVEDGKVLQPLLHNDIIQGREVKQQLDQSIADAQDDINKIEAKGNEVVNITSSQWTYNDTSKMYEKQITHTCNSENVHVTCKTTDTKEALFLPWKIVDKSNILLKSDEAINVSVVISARYYKALIDNTTTQEVIDARKGELTLKDKIDKIDEGLETIVNNNYCGIHFLNCTKDGEPQFADCTLLQTPNENILIDGGDLTTVESVLYNLDKLKVNKINTIILTHWHSDHCGGLVEIIKKYGCTRFISKTPKWENLPSIEFDWKTQEHYNKVKAELDKLNVNIEPPTNILNEHILINLFNLEDKTQEGSITDYNDESLLVKIKLIKSEIDILLCGDCPSGRYTKYLSEIGKIDILKAPHHNDNNYMSIEDLKILYPKHIISNIYSLAWSQNNYIKAHSVKSKTFCISDNKDTISYVGYFNNNNATKEVKFYDMWLSMGSDEYYYTLNGEMVRDTKYLCKYGLNKSKEGYFKFNSYGEVLKNQWVDEVYYANSNGELCCDGVFSINDNLYGFDKYGVCYPENTVQSINGKYYYVGQYGRIVKEKQYISTGGQEYCCKDGGEFVINMWSSKENSGSPRYYCYHNSKGEIVTNSRIFYNGEFIDIPSSGTLYTKPPVANEEEIYYLN